MDKVPQPVKNVVDHGFYKLKNLINKLFNNSKNKPIIRESKSAIKGFAKQYVVDGIEGTDAATFLNNAIKIRSCESYRQKSANKG